MKKTALVCGAGGFIGSHLVRFLKEKKYWVRGADLKYPKWSKSPADEFIVCDLRKWNSCLKVTSGINEVYSLAADMGGMGFISSNNSIILHNNSLINIYTIEASRQNKVKKYFFSSSVCIYPIDKLSVTHPKPLSEEDAYPALPQGGYGWEKLLHEIRCQYYWEEFGLETRIARFDNTYGPEGEYEGGREKAPAALCRKAVLTPNGGELKVWGDGKQTRDFVYVSDTVDGIYRIMQSDISTPVNLSSLEIVTINQLAEAVIRISGKNLKIKHINGPQGVRGRNFKTDIANQKLRWRPKVKLEEGLTKTFRWIENQV